MYRLVTDNSLEKKIYDRQVNKQGMADRIVDEMNPDAHLSTKDVHSLICDEEEDPNPSTMENIVHNYRDHVMQTIVTRYKDMLTSPPFAHESLLVDRKDNKLSKAEKKLAEKAYKLERKSNITYSRPSYAAFYPKQGTFATNLNNPGSNGFTRNRYYENGKKLDSWTGGSKPDIDPYHHVNTAFPTPTFSNVLEPPPRLSSPKPSQNGDWQQHQIPNARPKLSSIPHLINHSPSPSSSMCCPSDTSSTSSSTTAALSALTRQGVQVEHVLVSRDLSIPTGPDTEPILLHSGDKVMVIKTCKGEIINYAYFRTNVLQITLGIYLKMGEKIIKIKQLQAVQGLLGESNGVSS